MNAPEIVLKDKIGQEVRVGDRIAYATSNYSTPKLNIGTIVEIRDVTGQSRYHNTNEAYYKLRIDSGKSRTSSIEEWHGRYVKIAPEEIDG